MPPSADGDAPFQPVDPYALARNEAQAAQLKRFYKEATVAARDGGFALLLDGRDARTPARRSVMVPTPAAAAILAAEWNGQGAMIEPGEMPATRLVNSIIDGVADAMDPVRAEIVHYAGTDLLCYRADAPAELVALQERAWDPVLAWARDHLNARLYLAQGVVHVRQPSHAMTAIETAVDSVIGEGPGSPFRLGALHAMTTLTGSALLALAVALGGTTIEDAWAKAHVDEDFQISRWGEDGEAALRRQRRWREMQAAGVLAVATPV